jgi:hypothetical protein
MMTTPNDTEALASRKEALDVSKIFLSFLACGGDAVATCQLAECELDDVLWLSKVELWDRKLQTYGVVPGETDEQSLERTRRRNRMSLYIQAQRLRGIVDQTLHQIYENTDNLMAYSQERDKKGKPFFSTKPVRELVDAAEKIHGMLYRSLGDVVDRDDKKGPRALDSVRELHLTVIQQLQSAGGSVPEADLKRAEDVAGTAAPREAIGYLDVESALSDHSPS